MDYYDYSDEDKELKSVGLELMFLTPEKCTSKNGITAVELAKLVELPVEIVKKKLNILKDRDIVTVQRLDEDDDVFRLLCSFDDVDFDKYFSY